MARDEAVVYLGVGDSDLDAFDRSEILKTLADLDFLPGQEDMLLVDAALEHEAVDEIRNFEMEIQNNDGK